MSDRGLSASMNSEVGKKVVEPFLMAELMYDNDPLRAWSGVGNMDHGGETYLGTGQLGKVSASQETTGMQARGLKFEITGVPAANVSAAMQVDYQNRIAVLKIGFFDDSGDIIPDPVIIFKGRMDQQIVEDGGGPDGSSRIVVSAESRLIDLDRARQVLYDHEHQQVLYPGDKGFEYIAGLQEKEIPWGSAVGKLNLPKTIRAKPTGGGGGGVGPGGPGGR